MVGTIHITKLTLHSQSPNPGALMSSPPPVWILRSGGLDVNDAKAELKALAHHIDLFEVKDEIKKSARDRVRTQTYDSTDSGEEEVLECKSRASLGGMLLQLEWRMGSDQVAAVARAMAAYFGSEIPRMVNRAQSLGFVSHGGSGVEIAGLSNDDDSEDSDSDASLSILNSTSASVKSLNFHRLLQIIKNIVGTAAYTESMNEIMMDKASFGRGMAPSLTVMTRRCSCGAVRYFHTFCYKCGTSFDVKKELVAAMGVKLTQHPPQVDVLPVRAALKTKVAACAVRAADTFFEIAANDALFKKHSGYLCFLSRPLCLVLDKHSAKNNQSRYFRLTKKFMDANAKLTGNKTKLEKDEVGFISTMANVINGLHNVINLTDTDSELVRGLRSVRVVKQSPPTPSPEKTKHEPAAKGGLIDVLVPLEGPTALVDPPDADSVLRSQFFRESWLLRTPAPTDACATNDDTIGARESIPSAQTLADFVAQRPKISWGSKTKEPSERIRHNEGSVGGNEERVSGLCVSPAFGLEADSVVPRGFMQRLEDKPSEESSRLLAAEREDLEKLDLFLAECINYQEREGNELVQVMVEGMSNYQPHEYFGEFNPDVGLALPMSDQHCLRCHEDKGGKRCKKGRKNDDAGTKKDIDTCSKCGSQEFVRTIDYQQVLDGLLLPYIYRFTDERLAYQPPKESAARNRKKHKDFLPAVVRTFPVIRSYVNYPGEPEMSIFAFKHQCYFSTHVIYAFSDYGQYALNRQLFAEEFEFFVRNLEPCMTFLDPGQKSIQGDLEIVCEFVHCLKLLQYSPERDPELEPLMNKALKYILGKENQGGSVHWLPKGANSYDRYHAAYVAAVALEEFEFLTPGPKPGAGFRLPTILQWI